MNKVANPLASMRDRLLKMKASELGLSPTAALPNIWALLMETGYPEGTVTLVSIADGSASLYLPNSGGVIGAGKHVPVRAAGEALLKTAEFALSKFKASPDNAEPPEGSVTFFALTHQGVLRVQAVEEELGEGVGPLSALFHAGHALLAQVRIAGEGM